MKGKEKLSTRIIALITAAVFVAVLGFTFLGFYIGFWVLHGKLKVWRPDYDMLSTAELQAIYQKDDLSDDDYRILFEQTGLTKVGIDRAKAQRRGWVKVLATQQSYFRERKVVPAVYAPLICTDFVDGYPAEMTYLERGDIIISSATHFSGFKVGHAAIVTNGFLGLLYQSNQVGMANGYATASEMFTNRINFMVLRIKPEYFSENGVDDESYRNNLDRVTEYIETQFTDVPYSVFTGVFTKKDGMRATSCSHLLWYGFKHFDDSNGGKFNLDLDSNGRLLAMPKDISLSPYVELVQTFGFDPSRMYD